MSVKNEKKHQSYIAMYEDLKKSLEQGFYHEAIFIEYAILEDRITSVCKYSGLPLYTSDGYELSVAKKMRKIEDNLDDEYTKSRLTKELMIKTSKWIKKRNELIHDLANIAYDSNRVEKVAKEGRELLKVFQNKAQQVINHYKKEKK